MRSFVLECGVTTGVVLAVFNHLYQGGSFISLFQWTSLLLFVGTIAFTAALSYLVGLVFRRLGLLGFRDR